MNVHTQKILLILSCPEQKAKENTQYVYILVYLHKLFFRLIYILFCKFRWITVQNQPKPNKQIKWFFLFCKRAVQKSFLWKRHTRWTYLIGSWDTFACVYIFFYEFSACKIFFLVPFFCVLQAHSCLTHGIIN